MNERSHQSLKAALEATPPSLVTSLLALAKGLQILWTTLVMRNQFPQVAGYVDREIGCTIISFRQEGRKCLHMLIKGRRKPQILHFQMQRAFDAADGLKRVSYNNKCF